MHLSDSNSGYLITILNQFNTSFFPVEKRQPGIALVQEKKGHLRKLLADQVGKQLRKIPELIFFVDDSFDYFEEIDRLLKKG